MATDSSRKYRNYGKPLTAERLRERLNYDPLTGLFSWRDVPGNNPYAGRKTAGAVRDGGYIVIRIDGRLYRAQRLAWLHVTGEWPAGVVDHIDGDSGNNRFANLRDVTQGQNLLNRGAQKNSRSGIKGVSFQRKTQKWVAWIRRGPQQKYLGLFTTKEEAASAYAAAAADLHGEFARLA